MSRKRFAILVMVLGLAAMPAFTCLAPQPAAEMSRHSCCPIVAQHCDGKMSQAAQTCCQASDQSGLPNVSAAEQYQPPKAHTDGLPVGGSVVLPLPGLSSSSLTFYSVSPPRSSPGASSILRI
jgi:hypothetical protein